MGSEGPLKPYKEGYLWKRGGRHKTWKYRWFVLDGTLIKYYKKRDGDYINSVDVRSCHVSHQAGVKKESFGFLLRTFCRSNKRPNYVLGAPSIEEREDWIQHLMIASRLEALPTSDILVLSPRVSEALGELSDDDGTTATSGDESVRASPRSSKVRRTFSQKLSIRRDPYWKLQEEQVGRADVTLDGGSEENRTRDSNLRLTSSMQLPEKFESMSAEARGTFWRENILPRIEKSVQDPHIRQFWIGGVPSQVRGEVWAAAVGNNLQITPELYQICRQRAHQARLSLNFSLDSTGASPFDVGSMESVDLAATVSLPTISSPVMGPVGKESSMVLIDADLLRTFPEKPHIQESMRAVLDAYACYRPDVGYVQGMSYLAGMLVIHMDEYSAFVTLANLLHKSWLMTLYRFDQALTSYLEVYDRLLRASLPLVHKTFTKHSIEPAMYLIDWMLTVFSRALPFRAAARVWDCFVLHGDVFIFQLAIAMLKLQRKRLEQADFESCCQILKAFPRTVEETALFQCLPTVVIAPEEIEALRQRGCHVNRDSPVVMG
eukprot:Rmarinus@m.5525